MRMSWRETQLPKHPAATTVVRRGKQMLKRPAARTVAGRGALIPERLAARTVDGREMLLPRHRAAKMAAGSWRASNNAHLSGFLFAQYSSMCGTDSSCGPKSKTKSAVMVDWESDGLACCGLGFPEWFGNVREG